MSTEHGTLFSTLQVDLFFDTIHVRVDSPPPRIYVVVKPGNHDMCVMSGFRHEGHTKDGGASNGDLVVHFLSLPLFHSPMMGDIIVTTLCYIFWYRSYNFIFSVPIV
jgi:hypothetical protein